jgi:hypothetical protein
MGVCPLPVSLPALRLIPMSVLSRRRARVNVVPFIVIVFSTISSAGHLDGDAIAARNAPKSSESRVGIETVSE